MTDRDYVAAKLRNEAVFNAVYLNNPERLLDSLNHVDDINCRDDKLSTPLIVASTLGNNLCVSVLIEAGADIDATNKMGNNALMASCVKGQLGTMKVLTDAGFDVNRTDTDGLYQTAIMSTASRGYLDCVNYLIKAGADLDIRDSYGETALLKASRGGHLDCIERLIGAGADTSITCISGENAIHKAIDDNQPQVLHALIAAGVDLNQMSLGEESPLMLSARKDRSACMAILIEAGADVHLQNSLGVTALSAAEDYGKSASVAVLVEAGAMDRSKPSSPEITVNAIDEAVVHSQLNTLGYHLMHDPGTDQWLVLATDPETSRMVIDGKFASLATVAAVYDLGLERDPVSMDSLEKLIQEDALDEFEKSLDDFDINTTNSNGSNLLHVVAQYSRAEAASILINRGVDVDAVNKFNMTPLDVAQNRDNKAVASALHRYKLVRSVLDKPLINEYVQAAQDKEQDEGLGL